MKPALLVVAVLALSTASTLMVLRVRGQELHHGASSAFVISLALFNLATFSLLALLVP